MSSSAPVPMSSHACRPTVKSEARSQRLTPAHRSCSVGDAAARRLVENRRDAGALVLECTNMPPCAADASHALGLPVCDFYSLVCWSPGGTAAALVRPLNAARPAGSGGPAAIGSDAGRASYMTASIPNASNPCLAKLS